ncbi:hypothetical protein DBR17_17925 [Sphingomonas sp. HMWF008]|nr:hypothetical protein DBR17_17925 [Sphingomonas sp. HMWF008]
MREQAILDRDEDDMTVAEIAAELGLNPSYVALVINRYSGSWSANEAFDRMVRTGTIALAARIAAVGGRWA